MVTLNEVKSSSIINKPQAAIAIAWNIKNVHQRQQRIAEICIDDMNETGTFMHTADGQNPLWWMDGSTHQPMPISLRGTALSTFIVHRYGLSPSDKEYMHVVHAIIAHATALSINASLHALSAYDLDDQVLYLHLGKGDVLRVSADDIEKVPNGTRGIIFRWSTDAFDPAVKGKLRRSWPDMLFKTAVPNVSNMTVDEATALLASWFMFILLRDAASTRPILTALGPPGAAKTAMFKRVYAMLYGISQEINAPTTPDDFDHALSEDPLVVFDNADVALRWLPDRLAQASGRTAIKKRKLYTDNEVVLLRRHALVGLTSHNPEFTRPDVADRLMIIELSRHKVFDDEGPMLRQVVDSRDAIWGGVVRSLQEVFRTPEPHRARVPNLRIQDFATMGLHCADALGLGDQFIAAIGAASRTATQTVLGDEEVLVTTIQIMLQANKETGFMRPSELWERLKMYAPNEEMFSRRYSSPVALAKRLVAMQASLSRVCTIESKVDVLIGRTWNVGRLP